MKTGGALGRQKALRSSSAVLCYVAGVEWPKAGELAAQTELAATLRRKERTAEHRINNVWIEACWSTRSRNIAPAPKILSTLHVNASLLFLFFFPSPRHHLICSAHSLLSVSMCSLSSSLATKSSKNIINVLQNSQKQKDTSFVSCSLHSSLPSCSSSSPHVCTVPHAQTALNNAFPNVSERT